MASSSSPETLLQSALTALKQKDYGTAIAHFSTLQHHGNASTAQRLKAEMGLVRAYAGQGETATAIALCERLRQRPQAQVQDWASRMLTTLTSPPEAAPDASDCHPLPATGPGDATGFRPLTDGEPGDATGFRPLTPNGSGPHPAPSGVRPLEMPQAQPHNRAPSPGTAPSPVPPPLVPGPPSAPPPEADPVPLTGTASTGTASGPSLFHYATLNQAGAAVPGVTGADAAAVAAAVATDPAAVTTQLQTDTQLQPPDGASVTALPEAALPEADTPWQLWGAGRLERLRSLQGHPSQLQLWVTQIVTLGLSLGLMDWLLHRSLRLSLSVLRRMTWVLSPNWLGWILRDYTLPLLVLLGGILLASPWLWDRLLVAVYQQQPLSIQKLKGTHPEMVRTLRRICQQRGWPLPHLRSLPAASPLIFSYGWLPRNARIVVSQGWLDHLTDEEATTLLSRELAHMAQWTLPLMTLLGTVLQGCYQVYVQVARWGDRQTFSPLRASGAVISALAYGLYWLLRKPALALARTRTTYSDRQAVAWTGNPNGLTRALVKTATATAEAVAARGYVPPLLESVDLLTPLGYRSALTPGSLYPHGCLPQILTWEWQNPYRHWLTLNDAHPLLGDRLATLSRYAVQWGLAPELPLAPTARVRMRSKADFSQYWLPFLMQIAPYLGPGLGVAISLVMWFIGGLVNPLGVWQISWFYGDRSLLWGSLWLGLGIGTLVRINCFFPDINPSSTRRQGQVEQLLQNPMALPTDSIPVQIQGTLLGRHGMANWLCQDFWLSSNQGLLKLHFLSSLGVVGNLLVHPGHPSLLVGQAVTASGWFRRGACPWLDLDSFMRPGKRPLSANHPVWSAGLALASCGIGILIIFRGG